MAMDDIDRPGNRVRTAVTVIDGGTTARRQDYLATEEPLEIRLRIGPGGPVQAVAVTMRTPGADFELAAGFLLGEGVARSPAEIRTIRYCDDVDAGAQRYNIVTVELAAGARPDLAPLERHFTTTSACGVCGKASLEALGERGCSHLPAGPSIDREVLFGLPGTLQSAQRVFSSTGGLHAAGLFDASGALLAVREDVGRHNALDKLIGWAALRPGRLHLGSCLVLVSGRASYELAQKCVAAGIPVLCAVSAPSSLAVDLARSFGLTLVGFLRGRRGNVYAGAERIGR
jgi:FdhD protein